MIRPYPPVHPGEILREEFMVPLNLTAYSLAKHIGVPRTRIERFIREESGVTVDTALRLGRAFSTTPQFWLNLQANFDITTAENSADKDWLAAIDPIIAAA